MIGYDFLSKFRRTYCTIKRDIYTAPILYKSYITGHVSTLAERLGQRLPQAQHDLKKPRF
jgi:hypothetical protein